MPAESRAQQRFFGAELGRKRAGKATETGLSEGKLREFAGTSHKGLPEHSRGEVRRHAKMHKRGRDHARDDDDDRGREERHRRGDYDDHSGKDEKKTRGIKRKKGKARKSTSRRHVQPKRPHEKKAFLARLQEEGRESRSGDRD